MVFEFELFELKIKKAKILFLGRIAQAYPEPILLSLNSITD